MKYIEWPEDLPSIRCPVCGMQMKMYRNFGGLHIECAHCEKARRKAKAEKTKTAKRGRAFKMPPSCIDCGVTPRRFYNLQKSGRCFKCELKHIDYMFDIAIEGGPETMKKILGSYNNHIAYKEL